MPDRKNSPDPLGMSAEAYHVRRNQRRGWRYRRQRRAKECLKALRRLDRNNFDRILDVGVADSQTFDSIENQLSIRRKIGIDLSLNLMRFNNNSDSSNIQADAINLPFRDQQFELITATAVIEHVDSISRFLCELHRVLKPDGLVVITTPDPFWDSLVGRFLPLFDEAHVETLNLSQLEEYFQEANFDFHHGAKFMLSPIGFPFEERIEKILQRLGLTFTMLNQVALAAKPP